MTEIDLPPGTVDCRRDPGRVPWYEGEPYLVPTRPWTSVRGVTLHQTDANMGENPPRYFHSGAHAFVTPRGQIILLSDPVQRTIHADSFNTYDCGVEIVGQFYGVEGVARTFRAQPPGHAKPRKPSKLTPAQVEAARALLRYWRDLVAVNGGRLRFLHAHRQSRPTRRSDPGSAIWQQVALPAMEELGLTSGPVGWAAGGYPIPAAWDPRAAGVRY